MASQWRLRIFVPKRVSQSLVLDTRSLFLTSSLRKIEVSFSYLFLISCVGSALLFQERTCPTLFFLPCAWSWNLKACQKRRKNWRSHDCEEFQGTGLSSAFPCRTAPPQNLEDKAPGMSLASWEEALIEVHFYSSNVFTKTHFLFLLSRQIDISQPSLQLNGVMWLSSSQWASCDPHHCLACLMHTSLVHSPCSLPFLQLLVLTQRNFGATR